MKEKVLVIEDEKNIVELIRYNLAREGFEVLVALDGESGIKAVMNEKPDLLILDLMLPGIDGVELCKILKANYKTSNLPIIMLTAKTQETDVVLGLELGADDYVTKPFSPRQLMARVKAVLRRYKTKVSEKVLRVGKIELDTAKYLATLDGKPMDLTYKEFQILKFFMETGGRVLSREKILDHVWGQDESLEVDLRAVDKHVGELRKKLKNESYRLLTVKSFGYRFDLES